MTDTEFISKCQEALSNLCGVDYAYMVGDPAVDTLIELIKLAVEQKAEIKRLKEFQNNVYETVAAISNKIKSEARKEFAEKVIHRANRINPDEIDEFLAIRRDIFDNLVKEMEKDK